MIMTYPALAAAAASAALLIPNSQSARAELPPATELATDPACRPVIDQTTNGPINPILKQAIADFKDEGVNVVVRILSPIPDNVTSKDDLLRRQRALANRCGFAGTLAITLAVDPLKRPSDELVGFFNTQAFADAADLVPEEVIRANQAQLVADIRDTSADSPFQEDIGKFAARLHTDSKDTYNEEPDFPPEYPDYQPTENPEASEPPMDLPDIPWAVVAPLLAGLAVGGLSAARVKRQLYLRKQFSGEITAADELRQTILDIKSNSDYALAGLNEKDAEELRNLVLNLDNSTPALDDEAKRLRKLQASLSFRPWPGLRTIRANTGTSNMVISNAKADSQQAEALLKTLEEQKANIIDSMAEFAEFNTWAKKLTEVLSNDGWVIERYIQEITTHQEAQTQAEALQQDRYVAKTFEIIDEHLPELSELVEALKALPIRRDQADKKVDGMPEIVEQIEARSKEAEEIFAGLLDQFDTTDFEMFGESYANRRELTRRAAIIAEAIQAEKGVKDLTSIERVETMDADARGILRDMFAMVDSMDKHRAMLEDEREQLPQRIESIFAQIDATNQYIGNHSSDIKSQTLEELRRLTKIFNGEISSRVDGKQKPQLLILKGLLANYDVGIKDIQDHAEKQVLRAQQARAAEAARERQRQLDTYAEQRRRTSYNRGSSGNSSTSSRSHSSRSHGSGGSTGGGGNRNNKSHGSGGKI